MNPTAWFFAIVTLIGWGMVGVVLRSFRAERPLDNYSWYAYVGFILVVVIEVVRGFPILGSFEWSALMFWIGLTWMLASIASVFASEAAPTKIPLISSYFGLFPVVTAIGIFFLFHDPIKALVVFGITLSPIAVFLITRDQGDVPDAMQLKGLSLRAILFGSVALFGWGIVGILLRAVGTHDPFEPFMWYALCNVAAVLLMDIFRRFVFLRTFRWDKKRALFASVWCIGSLSYTCAAFFAPLAISQITAIAGLYPVLNATLIFLIFKDRFTALQWIGVLIAATAIIFLSGI